MRIFIWLCSESVFLQQTNTHTRVPVRIHRTRHTHICWLVRLHSAKHGRVSVTFRFLCSLLICVRYSPVSLTLTLIWHDRINLGPFLSHLLNASPPTLYKHFVFVINSFSTKVFNSFFLSFRFVSVEWSICVCIYMRCVSSMQLFSNLFALSFRLSLSFFHNSVYFAWRMGARSIQVHFLLSMDPPWLFRLEHF